MDILHLTSMDIVRAALFDAMASDLTLEDVVQAAFHAEDTTAFLDAVSMIGIDAIDVSCFAPMVVKKDNKRHPNCNEMHRECVSYSQRKEIRKWPRST